MVYRGENRLGKESRRASGGPEVLCERDLPEAADLHLRELGDEFLTRFGKRFVSRYYRAFVQSPDAAVFGVREPESGALVGVMAGASDAASHFSYLVRAHGPALASEAALACLKSPSLALEVVRTRLARYASGLLRTVRGGEDAAGDGRAAPGRPVGFAVYVAVRSDRRRSGAARALFRAFEEFCREAGAGCVEAATKPGGVGEKFFRSLGWERDKVRVTRSGESYVVFYRLL